VPAPPAEAPCPTLEAVADNTEPNEALLVGSLAEDVARVGRLPLLGSLAYTPQADELTGHRSNSAQRLRSLADSFTVPEDLAVALARIPGPVLLVDDYTESGWTLA
jgi:ATP-dependent DNA helicase RecQ